MSSEQKNETDSPAKKPVDLGIAGNMAKIFIHSPLAPLLYFALLGLGILGLLVTPRQEDPEISVPVIDLLLSYPGASAEQVEALAIEPLERIMSEIPMVKHVYSVSRHGGGVVTIQFKVGEKIGHSLVKVNDKIDSNLDKLPPGVRSPLVRPKGIDDVPVVTLTLWSETQDDSVLRALSLDIMQVIGQIPDTGASYVVGGRRDCVRINIKAERLSGYDISLDQVAAAVRSSNTQSEVGYIEQHKGYLKVYSGNYLRSAKDISGLVVGTYNGSPIYVRDVADVVQEPEEAENQVGFHTGLAYSKSKVANGAAAVTIAIAKKQGSNGVDVVEAVLKQVESLKGRMIPDDIYYEITRNYGETANEKVEGLIAKLFIVTAAVGILVWYFLGFRPAIVVSLIIPVVILITIFAAWLQGYSINRVSLFALIFSIGILVDDAIVVVENMYRRWLIAGDTDTETALDSVREVGNPTIIATFTVVAALLPMGFVSGMMGPYMQPIPALASVAMLASVVAAFVFTPWLLMRLRPGMTALRKAGEKEHKSEERIGRIFDKMLLPLIQKPSLGRMTLFGIIGAFFLSIMLFFPTKIVPVKMLPLDDKAEFSVVVDLPEGSSMIQTASLIEALSVQLKTLPEVVSLQTYVGTARPFDFNGMVRHYYMRNEPWMGAIQVQLVHKKERSGVTSHDLAVKSRALMTPIARAVGARITVAEMPPGPPVLQSVVAEIYSHDDDLRRQIALDVTKMFEQVEAEGMLGDVDNYMDEPHKIMHFEVDAEKAVRRGVSVETINRNLAMAMGKSKLGDVKKGILKEPTFISINIPLEHRSDTNKLLDLPIPGSQGNVPLAELGRFVEIDQDRMIMHKDLRSVEYVVADAVGRLAAPIYPMGRLDELIAEYKTPDGQRIESQMSGIPEDVLGVGIVWAGEWTVTYETFRDMGIAFAAALLLIYILVVGQFGNFLIPLIIMAPIPLTLIGIIPGHMILGAEFTATSMIGFIALAGIIVRNSILLVDFSLGEIRQGATVLDAVMDACKARTRPIIITALALIIDSLFILNDPIFQGMAVSLLFGVLVSTLLTLIVIPLGCVTARKSMYACAGVNEK